MSREEREAREKLEKEKEKQLSESIQLNCLVDFERKVGVKNPLRYQNDNEYWGYLGTKFAYGKARITTYFEFDEIGTIGSMYVDLNDVYEKYMTDKYYSFYEFIKRLNWGRRQFNVEEDWAPMNDYETTRMVVTSTSYNPNIEFNEYVHWGAALYDLIDILNSITDLNVKKYSSDELLDITAKKWLVKGLTILVLPSLLGIAFGAFLISKAIAKTFIPFLGWLLGIILILVFLFLLSVGISLAFSDPKKLKNNTLHITEENYKNRSPKGR